MIRLANWTEIERAIDALDREAERIRRVVGLGAYQPADADLTAVAALAGTGVACRIAADTWVLRNVVSGCGFTITNPAGVAGNISVGLTTDTPQLGGLGVGRPLSPGYLVDVFSAVGDSVVASTTSVIGGAGSCRSYADGGHVEMSMLGTGVAGNFFPTGIPNADLALVQSTSASNFVINTFGAAPLVIGTNTTVALTISATQAVSMTAGRVFSVDHIAEVTGGHNIVLDNATVCSSTVQATGLSAGRALGAGLLVDAYSTVGDAVVAATTTVNTASGSCRSYANGGQIQMDMLGTAVAGNIFGATPYADLALVQATNATNMAVGTIGAVPLILFTNTAAAMTISGTQVITCASTLQATGLSIGRALSAGFLLDVYSPAGDACAGFVTGSTSGYAYWAAQAECGASDVYVAALVYGSAYAAGAYFGQNWAGNAFMVSSNMVDGMAIGTYSAKQVVIGTNNTAAVTVSATQTVTCASTLRATGLSVGRALGAGLLVDAYSSTTDAVIAATTTVATASGSVRSIADGCYIQMDALGTSVPGNIFGATTYADLALVQATNATNMAVGTTGAVPLILFTNTTAAMTISGTQVITCSSTLQATGLSVGRVVTEGLVDIYSTTAHVEVHAYTTSATKYSWFRARCDGGFADFGMGGTNTGGTAFGVSSNDCALAYATDVTNMVVGTISAASLILGTNNAAAITVNSTQYVTLASRFGCNGAVAQAAYASGGALAAYAAGANGYDTAAHASELHAMVVKIRAALVANGIMS